MLLILLLAMATFGSIQGANDNQASDVVPCGFERTKWPTCWYNLNAGSDNPWKKQKAADATGGKPTSDHTKQNGNGHYAVVEGTKHVQAYLAGYAMTIAESQCLSFWFYVDDDSHSFLEVYLIDGDSTPSELFYFSESSGLSGKWVQGKADVTSNGGKIYFAAKITDSPNPTKNHFVILDDVELHAKTCAEQFGSS